MFGSIFVWAGKLLGLVHVRAKIQVAAPGMSRRNCEEEKARDYARDSDSAKVDLFGDPHLSAGSWRRLRGQVRSQLQLYCTKKDDQDAPKHQLVKYKGLNPRLL